MLATMGKQDDDSIIRQVPGKQKKPGNPIISGFPGIDTKTALRFGRLFLFERLFLNMAEMWGFEPQRRRNRPTGFRMCPEFPNLAEFDGS